MDELLFWELIESSWSNFLEVSDLRKSAIIKPTSSMLITLSRTLNEEVIPILSKKLDNFSEKELDYFDQILEKKLYDIDREDLQNVIEGGDDQFLYNRGFIIGMGKKYYQAISNNPSVANDKNSFYWSNYEIGSQNFCFFAEIIFSEKYDKPMSFTGLSKETGSNTAKWNN